MRSVVSASADLWRLPWLARAQLTSAERVTLDVGLAVVLTAVTVGTQVGGWPLWTVAAAFVGYLAWSIVYSEATIQAALWLAAEPASPPREVDAAGDAGSEQRSDDHEQRTQTARPPAAARLTRRHRSRVLVAGRL